MEPKKRPIKRGLHWGNGRRNAVLEGKSSRNFSLAALALALARFEARKRVVLALYGHPAFELSHAGNFAGRVRALVVDLNAAPDAAALLAQVRSGLASGPTLALADCLNETLIGVSGPFLHQLTPETKYAAHLQAPFALTVAILATDEAQPCELDINTTRYAMDMAHEFVRVACGMALQLDAVRRSGAATPVDAIEWLQPDHAAEVVALGQGAALPSGAVRERIEQRIARHAARHPTQIAVSCEGRQMDFATLTDTAAQVATVLAGLGVREGDFVGVLMERCIEIVPVLLGVLRSGAAYVPVDSTYPAERIAFTLSDAAPSVVIGDRPEGAGGVWIDAKELLARASQATPCSEFATGGAEAAAYVIYTSGSTGRPKGVVVPHCNVCALIDATQSDFGYGSEDTWTLFHSTAFDFSVWEIWACLGSGGRLVVVPFWVTRSPDDFRQLLESERVTVLSQTPSAFAQLLEAECRRGEASVLALRLVVFGGEQLDCRMLARWFDRYPESVCRLVNMFGITETTVHVTAETLTRAHALSQSRAVGPAIPGWSLYVLDEAQRLTPPGVIGEIFVAGEGVAREYWGRADLTAQRFIEDPFNGGRMYRSGDRGRLRPDGRLEHLGRLDSQVKIRGFRIELDEIRAVMLNCPGVQSAAVVVHRADPDDPASARLDAYVVMSEGSTIDVRQHATRTLPSYMTPATYTVLPALPLTSNGKLDSKRLPPPQLSVAAQKAPPATIAGDAPGAGKCSLFENMLLEVWSEVLGTKVTLDDNFFDLGGNSLYAVRLLAAMRRRSMTPLAVRELYLHQTVRKIAQVISPRNQEEAIA